MKSQTPIYRQIYQQGRDKGFDITVARQYYNNNNEKQPMLEVEVDVPYKYQGQPVTAYAVVDMSGQKRHANTIEFWQNGQNIEDLADKTTGTRDYQLETKNGQQISYENAAKRVGQFAEAASQYPHVFTYNEYITARTPINKRLQLDPPTANDYQKYLEHMSDQLMDKDITFIGDIRSRKQLSDLYMSIPDELEGMNDIYDETDYTIEQPQ